MSELFDWTEAELGQVRFFDVVHEVGINEIKPSPENDLIYGKIDQNSKDIRELVPRLGSSVHEFGNSLSSVCYAEIARALYLTTLSYSILVRHSKACSALTL